MSSVVAGLKVAPSTRQGRGENQFLPIVGVSSWQVKSAIEQLKIKPALRALLLVLESFRNVKRGRSIFPTIEKIAERYGKSYRMTIRDLKIAESLGFISIDDSYRQTADGRYHQGANSYELLATIFNPPSAEELAEYRSQLKPRHSQLRSQKINFTAANSLCRPAFFPDYDETGKRSVSGSSTIQMSSTKNGSTLLPKMVDITSSNSTKEIKRGVLITKPYYLAEDRQEALLESNQISPLKNFLESGERKSGSQIETAYITENDKNIPPIVSNKEDRERCELNANVDLNTQLAIPGQTDPLKEKKLAENIANMTDYQPPEALAINKRWRDFCVTVSPETQYDFTANMNAIKTMAERGVSYGELGGVLSWLESRRDERIALEFCEPKNWRDVILDQYGEKVSLMNTAIFDLMKEEKNVAYQN